MIATRVMLALSVSLVLTLLVPASAQEVPALRSGVEGLFGAERTKRLTSDLQDVGGKLVRPAQAAAAARLIRFYAFMARVAKTDQERKMLEYLRPRFQESIIVFTRSVSEAAGLLEPTSFGKDYASVYQQVAKIVDNPEAAAEFYLLESELLHPYGVSPIGLVFLYRDQKSASPDDLQRLKDAANKVPEKVKSIDSKDLARYGQALMDMAEGGATVIGDLAGARTAPLVAILSTPGGIKKFAEGFLKLFG
jgi:hypothetical protein